MGVSLPVPEVRPEDYRSGVDHLYARPAVALATTHAAECQTEDIDSITQIKALEVTNQQQAATVLRLESEISKLKEELRILSFSADSLLPSDEAVQFYTGFTNRRVYEQVFQYIASKAENMHYWRGESKDYDKAKTNKGFQLPCLGRVTRTMSVALLLRNNPKRKKSNFAAQLHLPAHDLFWANLKEKSKVFKYAK